MPLFIIVQDDAREMLSSVLNLLLTFLTNSFWDMISIDVFVRRRNFEAVMLSFLFEPDNVSFRPS